MNFFQSQAKARSQTTKLVLLFSLAVIGLVVVTNILVMFLFGFLETNGEPIDMTFLQQQFDWTTFFVIAAIVISVIVIASLYKITTLSGGGKVIAQSLGGTLVEHSTEHHQYKVLLNVVEEMALASGTPVPQVYVLKNESAINAFAAGFTLDDAVIGVTQGALDYFNREELQGVIAHEFSHIVHGDMRINMRLIGILHGILALGLIGYYIMRVGGTSRSSKNDNGSKLALLGIGLIIIGYSGTFFGNIIKAAISRQREYLADASAVQYTRNNRGIANALKKIGGYSNGSKLAHSEAPSMSHAYFASGITSHFRALFATHPPLDKRIKSIEPYWQGRFAKLDENDKTSLLKEQEQPQEQTKQAKSMAAVAAGAHLVDSIGQLDASHIERAQAFLATLPATIKDGVHTTSGATAAIYGLLLAPSDDEQVFHSQLEYLEKNTSQSVIRKWHLMAPQLQSITIEQRLPLVEIALPQLRQMSQGEYQQFLTNIRALIMADDKIELFEWCVERIVRRYLRTEFERADRKSVKHRSLQSVQSHIETLASILCALFVEPAEREQVLSDATQTLGLKGLKLDSENKPSLADFSKAIDELSLLKPELKQQLVEFSYFIVTQDDDYSVEEREVIRVLADSLGCPVPMH